MFSEYIVLSVLAQLPLVKPLVMFFVIIIVIIYISKCDH